MRDAAGLFAWECVVALERSVEEFACLGIGLVFEFGSRDCKHQYNALSFSRSFHVQLPRPEVKSPSNEPHLFT